MLEQFRCNRRPVPAGRATVLRAAAASRQNDPARVGRVPCLVPPASILPARSSGRGYGGAGCRRPRASGCRAAGRPAVGRVPAAPAARIPALWPARPPLPAPEPGLRRAVRPRLRPVARRRPHGRGPIPRLRAPGARLRLDPLRCLRPRVPARLPLQEPLLLLRAYCLYRRALLGDLARLAARIVTAGVRATTGEPQLSGGDT